MASQHDKKQPADQPNPAFQRLKDDIGKHVIATLGLPRGLWNVQVRELWQNHYRVNVLIGADAGCAKVAHSYFLVLESDGSIAASTPALRKLY